MGGQNTFVDNRPVRNAGDVPFTPAGIIDAITVQNALVELSESTKLYHGIESIGTVSFSNANKTLNITDATTYWYKGQEVTTGALSCDLDLAADRDHASATLTTNTLYYFYFKDATG